MSYPPAPYQQPEPVRGKPRLRGRIPLRLAAIFGVIGVALVIIGALLLVNGSLGKIDGFTRVSIAEGAKTVELDRTGKYVGYYETPSDASHGAFVRMQITDSAGRLVTLHLYGQRTHLTYDDGKRHGEALFTFSISKAGAYRVQVRSADAASGADVALGESIAHGLAGGVLTLVPGVLLVIAAIVLLIVGLVRRSGHKSELRRFASGPPLAYPGGPQGYGLNAPPGGYQPGGYQPGGYPAGGYQPGGYPPSTGEAPEDGPAHK